MKIVYVFLLALFVGESTYGAITHRLIRDPFGQNMNTHESNAPDLADLANETPASAVELQDFRSRHFFPAHVLPIFVRMGYCWYSFVIFACLGHLPDEAWDSSGDLPDSDDED